MYTQAEALLNNVDGGFNLSDMAVCKKDVELNREQVIMCTGKLMVHMYVAHMEAMMPIQTDSSSCRIVLL